MNKILGGIYSKFNYIILGYVIFCILIPKFPIFFIGDYPTPVRIEDFLWLLLIVSGITILINQKISIRNVFFSKISISILVWLSISLVSTLINISKNHIPFSNLLFYIRFFQYLSLYYLSQLFPLTQTQFKWVLKLLLASTTVVIIWSLLQFMGLVGGFGGGFYNYQYINGTDRVFASFSGPYELAGYLLLILPILISQIIMADKVFRKVGLFMVWLLAVLILGFSGARFPVIVASLSILPLAFIKFSIKNLSFIFFMSVLTIAIPLLSSKTMMDRFSTLTISQAEYLAQLSPSPISSPTLTLIPTQILLPTDTPTITKVPTISNTQVPTDMLMPTISPGLPTPTNIQINGPSPTIVMTPTQVIPTPTIIASNIIDQITKPIKSIFQALATNDRSLDLRINVNWPLAWARFRQNPLLGGGLGAVGVGVDGEFVTLLGETGILGLIAFFLIFILMISKLIHAWKSNNGKNGLIELALSLLVVMLVSGLLSDNFRASKIAILFWFLIGTLINQIKLQGQKEQIQ